MGTDSSVMRKIRIGQLHGAAFTGGGLAEAYPNIAIYGLPMLFSNLAEVDYVRARMDKVFEAGMEDAGFVNFGIAEGGFAMFMGSKAIRTTANLREANLRDEKAWVPEGDTIAYAAYEALGVSPVALPLTDVLTGLQTGLVSTVAASPLAAVALQWHTRIKYVADVPMSYVMGVLAINKKAFDRVSPDDQAIVRQVLLPMFDELTMQNRADNEAARAALIEQGIEFLRPTDDTISEWRDISRQVFEQKGKEGAFNLDLARKVVSLIEEFRRKENDRAGEQ
jgi:TRAP-type C4-dicarboxylate transport system substrate-binding protein